MKKFLPSRRKEPQESPKEIVAIENRPASSSTLAKEIEHVAAEVSPAAPTEGVIEPVAETPPADDAIEYVEGWKLWSMLISIASVFILVLLDMSIVATAIPQITSRFHSLRDVGWYGSAYLLASAALQPLTGKIYSLFNTKWTFISFFLLFEFGSLICGVANSSMMLIIGRAIAGMGGSGLVNGGMQIIYQAVPENRRPFIMGILMAISQIGLVGGPVLGGVLTEYASWRWCFYINLPVGAVATAILAVINIPDRKHKPDFGSGEAKWKAKAKKMIHELDLKGFVIFSGFSIMLVLALQWGGVKYAWSSSRIIGLLVGVGVLLLIFCAQEYRIGDRAMFPWSVIKQTVVWSSGITQFLFFGSQMLGNYYLPIYFQTVRDASPAQSGLYILPSIFGTMLLGLSSGFLVSKWGYYTPWMIFSGVFAGVGSGLLSIMGLHTPPVQWVWFQLILGFGRGAGMQMPIVAIQTNLQPKMVPVGQAFIIFQQTFGGAFWIAIGQTVFNSALGDALKKFAPQVDAERVIHAGASGVRDVVQGSDLNDVLRAFNEATKHDFYMAAALSSLTAITALGMGWKKVAKKADKKPATPVDVEKTAAKPAESEVEMSTSTRNDESDIEAKEIKV